MSERMGQAQISAGKELIAYLKSKYGISKVQKHKDVNPTNCPGTNFPYDVIVNGETDRWVQDSTGWWYRHADGSYTKTTGRRLTETGIISTAVAICIQRAGTKLTDTGTIWIDGEQCVPAGCM